MKWYVLFISILFFNLLSAMPPTKDTATPLDLQRAGHRLIAQADARNRSVAELILANEKCEKTRQELLTYLTQAKTCIEEQDKTIEKLTCNQDGTEKRNTTPLIYIFSGGVIVGVVGAVLAMQCFKDFRFNFFVKYQN